MKKILLLFAFVLGFVYTYSQENEGGFNETVQEFFIGEPVFTQGKGQFQISPAWEYFTHPLFDTNVLKLGVEYGITNQLQVGIGFNYMSINYPLGGTFDQKGIHNTEIGIGYNLYNSPKWSVSAMLEAELPTASDNFGEQEFEFSPVLVAATQLGFAQVHISTLAEIGETTDFGYNIVGVFPFKKMCGVLELNGFLEQNIFLSEKEYEHSWMISPGIFFKPAEIVELGVGFPISLSESEYWGVVVGLSVEFGGE